MSPSVVTRTDKTSRRFRFRSGVYAVPNTSTTRHDENDLGLLAAGSRAGGYAIALGLLSEISHPVPLRQRPPRITPQRRSADTCPGSFHSPHPERGFGVQTRPSPRSMHTGTVLEMLFRLYRHFRSPMLSLAQGKRTRCGGGNTYSLTSSPPRPRVADLRGVPAAAESENPTTHQTGGL